MEEKRRRELNSISFEFSPEIMMNHFSSLSSNPLFSSVVTIYSLILLYFPNLLFRIVCSPILICTGILLLALLRFGAIQRSEEERKFNASEQTSMLQQPRQKQGSFNVDDEFLAAVGCEKEVDSRGGLHQNPFDADSFIEWNVRAPLEAIYEEYEGKEEENDDVFDEMKECRLMGIERYASLSLYYPETDSDGSSDGYFPVIEDWNSSERMSFVWEEEDDREGLIEIALDGKRNNEVAFHVEEENLIEIDISPTRKDEFPGDSW